MTLNSKIIAPAVIIIFIAGITGSILFNQWHTTGTKSAADINTPADIKGSGTFSLISEGLGIPLQDMLTAFAITGKTDIQCKELETIYAEIEGGEIGTDSVRLFASLYTGLPHSPEEGTRLPLQAYTVLKDKADPSLLEANKDRFIEITSASKTGTDSKGTEETHIESADDTAIKGKTTFEDLMTWGLSKQEIETAIGGPIGVPGGTVKSLADAQGVEFGTWKTVLQKLVDSKK